MVTSHVQQLKRDNQYQKKNGEPKKMFPTDNSKQNGNEAPKMFKCRKILSFLEEKVEQMQSRKDQQ